MIYYPNSGKKAVAVTTSLALLGIFYFLFGVHDIKNAVPLAIFYAVIVVNTFFSVKCFSSIIPPENKFQWAVDVCLIFSYILMAINMDKPEGFTFWAAVLFSIAVFKYATLPSSIGHRELLKYKIVIDSIGTLSCVLALGGVIYGHAALAVWTWTIIFALANIFIFFIKPLYKLPE